MPLAGTYDAALVVLSVLIAVFASYTALDLAGRVGLSHSAVADQGWLGAAALAMGGGIWSMHFVGMLAYRASIPVSYAPLPTFASLVLAVLGTGSAFRIAAGGRSPRRLALSGLLMGSSIAGMHYTGMAAMRVAADLHYRPVLVALSVLIAVGAATAGLHLAVRAERGPRRDGALRRLAASVAMGFAVAGMHYTGMAAAHLGAHADAPGLGGPDVAAGARQASLALAVSAATFLILFLGLVASLFDRRFAVLAEREAVALRESEEKFRTLYRHTPVPLHSLDARGRIEQVSDAWLALLGYARDRVIGRPFAEFLAPEYRAAHERGERPAFWEALVASGAVRDVEVRLLAQDGRAIEALVSARVEGGGEGETAGGAARGAARGDGGEARGATRVLGSLVDVTERRRTEAQLRQSQKMEAMGQLTGGVAHDFNNLLQIIGGSLDLLERGRDPARRIAAMRQAVGRGQGLTRQLLAFSRRQSFALAVVDLRAALPGMREMLARSLRGDIEIAITVAEDLWPVEIDAGEFELALLNLSVNARDAMPGGGRLLVDARNVRDVPAGAVGEGGPEVRRAPAADVGGEGPPAGYVRLTVEDSGTGMSPEVLARVFEPFFTTKEVGKGSGLGLSQAYGFARQSGGALAIDSREGWGTRVALYLPRTRKSAALEEARRPAAADEAKGEAKGGGEGEREGEREGGRALLVEDDSSVAEVVRALLEQLRYRVVHAPGPAEALRALREAPAMRYDVVLSDVIMPGGANGLDLAHAVRRNHPGVAMVLMTGYDRGRGEAIPPGGANAGGANPHGAVSNGAVSNGSASNGAVPGETASALLGGAIPVPDDVPLLRKPFEVADLARAVEAARARPREVPREVPRRAVEA